MCAVRDLLTSIGIAGPAPGRSSLSYHRPDVAAKD
jgi:hypothetical protein